MRPPKPTPNELHLIRENDSLKTAIVELRREIENKQGHVQRLEICSARGCRRSIAGAE
jgi:hypothetical protein